jgi:hypothetical protein
MWSMIAAGGPRVEKIAQKLVQRRSRKLKAEG